MNFKSILIMAFVALIIAGCTQPPANGGTGANAGTAGNGAGAAGGANGNGVAQEISQLGSAPTDYCITYTTGTNTEAYGGGSFDAVVEYCLKGTDKVTNISFGGGTPGTPGAAPEIVMTNYCLQNGTVAKTCGSGYCSDDSSGCSGMEEPFATANWNESDLMYYKKTADRTVAGVQAKCYSVNLNELAQQAGANIGGETLPAGSDRVEFCFHPQYKQFLYYAFGPTTVQVTNYVTPAPASKFVLPADTGAVDPYGTQTG
ncbi:MAG: hypothetical protein Q7S92_04990 [Candidatus Diapherotrites archaeon]|nr:hypothetical protein [Candidatus Diapherotrites archaeon]